MQLLLIVLISPNIINHRATAPTHLNSSQNSMMQWLSTPNSWSNTMWKGTSLSFISSKLYEITKTWPLVYIYTHIHTLPFYTLKHKAQILYSFILIQFLTTTLLFCFVHVFSLSTSRHSLKITISKLSSFFMKILHKRTKRNA